MSKSKLGIALGGGAALGWAHIGVLKTLESHFSLKPNMIAGTSIGSIVGGAYAVGKLEQLEKTARALTMRDMLFMGEFGFGRGGMIGTGKIEELLSRHLGDITIEEMPIPFAAVAADIMSGEVITLREGSLLNAVRASSAVPGIFPAVDYKSHWLVDGGVLEPLPVRPVHEMGADIVIGVPLQSDYEGVRRRIGLTRSRQPGLVKTARASMQMGLRTLADQAVKLYPADVLIKPNVGHMDPANFTRAEELIELGRSATLKMAADLEAVARKLGA